MGRPRIPNGGMGEPTTREIKRGLVRARVRWRDELGFIHEATATGRTKADAKAAVRARVEEARLMRGDGTRDLSSVAKRWLEWLEDADEDDDHWVRPSTVAQYRATWNSTLDDVVGHIDINALTTAQAYAALQRIRRRGVRGRQPRQVLSMVLRWAATVGQRTDGVNPLAVTEQQRRRKRGRKTSGEGPRALTAAEWNRLVEKAASAARRHHRATIDLHDLLVVLRYTGARIGEGLAIQWGDLNLAGDPASVTIERTLLEPRPGVPPIGPTKGNDRRIIYLHPEAVEVLERRMPLDAKPDAFVFAVGRDGKPMSAANARTRLRALVRDTDLDWVTPHTLRRSAATAMKRTRGTSVAAARLLGHADDGRIAEGYYIDDDGTVVVDPRAAFDEDGEEPAEGPGCAVNPAETGSGARAAPTEAAPGLRLCRSGAVLRSRLSESNRRPSHYGCQCYPHAG